MPVSACCDSFFDKERLVVCESNIDCDCGILNMMPRLSEKSEFKAMTALSDGIASMFFSFLLSGANAGDVCLGDLQAKANSLISGSFFISSSRLARSLESFFCSLIYVLDVNLVS